MTRNAEKIVQAGIHALRSYQHGNASPDLAETIAEQLESLIKEDGVISRARVAELARSGGFEGFAAFIEQRCDLINQRDGGRV